MTVILDYKSKRDLIYHLGERPRYTESNTQCPEFRNRGRVLCIGKDKTWRVTIVMRYGKMVEVI